LNPETLDENSTFIKNLKIVSEELDFNFSDEKSFPKLIAISFNEFGEDFEAKFSISNETQPQSEHKIYVINENTVERHIFENREVCNFCNFLFVKKQW
jgi:hypothetical protein